MAAEPNEILNAEEQLELTALIDGKNYTQQACFFMNAYWTEITAKEQSTGNDIKEEIYQWTHLFEKFDKQDKDGKKLDSLGAARVWEALGETLTHIAMRKKLAAVDLDADGNMSMIEFLLCKDDAEHFDGACYNFSEMMSRPQGTNEALEKAIAKVTTLVGIGEKDAKKEADIIKKIEKYEGKVVKQNRSKNELATHRARDMQPFNRALITAEAALRKARKVADCTASGSDWFVDRDMKEVAKYKPKGDLKGRN